MNALKPIIFAAITSIFALGVGVAQADDMKKDSMEHDGMKKDDMNHDEMEKDNMQ